MYDRQACSDLPSSTPESYQSGRNRLFPPLCNIQQHVYTLQRVREW